MRKHAYLVMVHNNYGVLEKCMRLLDAPYNDFYIHVDKKARDFPAAHFQSLLADSRVYVYQEMEVNWAGFSQVQCELFLLEQALGEQYGFYHLLSGADMPIQEAEAVYRFFEEHEDRLFVNVQPERLQRHYWQYRNRICRFHPLQEARFRSSNRMVRGLLTFAGKVLLALQIICRIDRIKGLEIHCGSQWFSIPHDFAAYLIGHKSEMERLFRWSKCPDEHAIQMMAMDSPFRGRLYRDEQGEFSNMRYIEWKDEDDPHPVTFRQRDVERVLASGKCFARKFDENADYGAVEEIYARIKGKI